MQDSSLFFDEAPEQVLINKGEIPKVIDHKGFDVVHVTAGGPDDYNPFDENPGQGRKKTEEFRQMMSDEVLVNDIIMDDIMQEMHQDEVGGTKGPDIYVVNDDDYKNIDQDEQDEVEEGMPETFSNANKLDIAPAPYKKHTMELGIPEYQDEEIMGDDNDNLRRETVLDINNEAAKSFVASQEEEKRREQDRLQREKEQHDLPNSWFNEYLYEPENRYVYASLFVYFSTASSFPKYFIFTKTKTKTKAMVDAHRCV